MKADAIKEAAAIAATGNTPPKALQNEALAEALDIALGFFADVRKIATAIDRVAGCESRGRFDITTVDG